MNFPFQKTISAVLIGGQFSMMFTCISAYAADAVTPQGMGATDAYILQKQTMNDLNNTHVVGNNITFGNSKVQKSINTSDNPQMNTNDLTPTTANKIPANKYYVNKSEPSTASMQATYKLSDDGIDVLANQKKDNMDTDLTTDDATLESQAYSTIAKVAAQSKPIDANDPIFNRSQDVMDNTTIDLFNNSDCALDKKIMSMKSTVHHADYKECTDAPVNETGCTLYHSIQPTIAVNVGSTGGGDRGAMYDTCENNKENCISIGFGKKYGNSEKLNSGGCGANTVETSFEITNKSAIRKAYLKTVRFAGSVKGGFKSATGNTNYYFNYEENKCAPNTEGKNYYIGSPQGTDVTEVFTNARTNVVTMFVEYTGAMPYVQVEIEYDPSLVVKNDTWTDDNCAAYAKAIHSGDLKGSVKCTYYAPSVPANDPSATHIFMNGVLVDKKYVSSLAGLESNCAKAEVKLEANQFKDGDGNPSTLPKCDDLKKQNSNCSQAATTCMKYDASNKCILSKSSYDCGYNKTDDVPYVSKTYKCDGAISCSGLDCVNIMVDSNNEDFTKALGLMQMTQQGTNDVTCTFNGGNDLSGVDPNKPLNEQGDVQCTLWAGKEKTCKIFYTNGGLGAAGNDCCHGQQMDADVAAYIRNQAHMFKLYGIKETIMSGDFSNLHLDYSWSDYGPNPSNPGWGFNQGGIADTVANGIYSVGWQYFVNFSGVGQKFNQLVEKINKPIVDRLNNLIPYAGDVFAGINGFIEQQIINAVGDIVKEAVQYIFRAIMKQVEGALKDMGMDWAGGKISEIFGSSVSSVFSTFFKKVVPIIGWIYAIYQGVQLVINLLTKCDNDDTSKDPNGKNDYELQNDIHLYRCDFVSKYCSMKNPLHIGGCGLGGCVGDCVEFTEVYCCFDSPLSRILNKQVRYAQKKCPNLWPWAQPSCAFGFGEKHAICWGITLPEIEEIDWKKIDLTEWLNLLTISGMSPAEITNYGHGVDSFLPIGGRDQNNNKHDLHNQHPANSGVY